MKTFNFSSLNELGINPLTGESCKFAMRILCDLSSEGEDLVKEYFGIPNYTDLAKNWNTFVGERPAVACIMLERGMFDSLLRFAIFREGYKYAYGKDTCYVAYRDSDLEGNYGLTQMHKGELSHLPGDLHVNPSWSQTAPALGTRNIHAFSGRAL